MIENDVCTTMEEAEAFFDRIAFKRELLNKEVQGRVVQKVIKDRDVSIDRRTFSYTGNKFTFMAYAFRKDPLLKDSNLYFRGKVMRLDFLPIEEKIKAKPRLRDFSSEVMFGLGYKTAIDEDPHFYWGQMGCMGEFPSRTRMSQFEGDVEGTMRRMNMFDKNALIAGEIVTWNPLSGMGTLDTPVQKKVFVKLSDLPKGIKKPRKGIKLRLRLLSGENQSRCYDALPG
jgi:hypothetical protein